MKWFDIPPVWLVGAIFATFTLAEVGPEFFSLMGAVVRWSGTALIAIGLLIMILAAVELARHRTTVIPHLEADNLVRTGVFRFSRNPIYLGDVLVLTGLILRWDAVAAMPLIPMFVWILTTRFILPEEVRLTRKFGSAFETYRNTTRRWI